MKIDLNRQAVQFILTANHVIFMLEDYLQHIRLNKSILSASLGLQLSTRSVLLTRKLIMKIGLNRQYRVYSSPSLL